MPTYVYRREDGTLFEVFQNITDPPLTEDPETGQKVTRVITGGAGLQFKGSGFYLTDYVRKGGGEKKEGGEKAETKSETKAEPKPEAKAGKPASKPAAKSDD
jgi:predicted nucleic acid-binding Zn ribbon protein